MQIQILVAEEGGSSAVRYAKHLLVTSLAHEVPVNDNPKLPDHYIRTNMAQD